MKIVLVLVVMLVCVFILQNSQESMVRFLFWSSALPQNITLFFVFLSGIGVGMLSFWLLGSKFFRQPRMK